MLFDKMQDKNEEEHAAVSEHGSELIKDGCVYSLNIRSPAGFDVGAWLEAKQKHTNPDYTAAVE